MRISGAEGENAWLVNGVFDPVEGGSEGMPVYCKRDNADEWLEYYAPRREWVVTSTEGRGTGAACAWLSSDPPRLPDHTLGSVWQVWDGDEFVDQPSVSVTLVSCSFDSSRWLLLLPFPYRLSPFLFDDSDYFGDDMRLVRYSSANDYQGPSVEEEAAARAVAEMEMRQALQCP